MHVAETKRQKVFAALNSEEPVADDLLFRRLATPPYAMDRTEAERVVGALTDKNEIRWVAFYGYVKGGRAG